RVSDFDVPNRHVDLTSWGTEACYPRGSFYPLSDGPSMRNHRITKPDFRPCSTCRSRSQAPLCLYTLRMISNHSEGIFGRLRYLLGGARPSQTARLKLSPDRITVLGLKVHTARVVSHGCLHRSCRSGFDGSYLSCTSCTNIQYQATVKLHGVFPSCRG